MKKSFILLLSCCFYYPVYCWFFEHDRAVYAGQHENWSRSLELLKSQLSSTPDSPQLLYDAGVASYKLGHFEQANAYFDAATTTQKNDDQLKEKAYFNRGNAQVQLKKLRDAIESYEKALAIDPQDKQARHNLEIVKKMLEEQKKQEQQQKDKKQQQDKKNKQSQQQQQQEKNKDQDQEQQDKQDQQESSGGQGKQDQSKQQQQSQDQGNEREQQGGKEQEKEGNKGKSGKDKQGKEEEKNNQKQGDGKRDQQPNQSVANAAKKQQEQDQQVEAWIAQALEENEKKDAHLNKQLMKTVVHGREAEHGQQCW